MNQAEFAATPRTRSQCDAILSVLSDRQGDWVSMIDLWGASGAFAVHSRISDLRARGHMISHKNERKADGTIHSFYRIEKACAAHSSATTKAALQTEFAL